jgi:CubicO group peptidase (beta-lactamase class C family)
MPLLTVLALSALPVLIYWVYSTETIYLHAISVLSTLLSTSATLKYCLPSSPLLPPPKVLSDSLGFDIPDSTFANQVWLPDTSYAIKASIGDLTIFEHEHSAPGREVVQSLLDTSLRVGSVTKTFTVLAILRSADKIKLSDPVTKFIPELSKEVYEDVTIGALASHTSGLGRYVYVGDLAVVPGFNPAALGLPSVDSTGNKVSTCDPFPGGRICTREEVIAGLNNPAYHARSPDSGPLYSNIGYALLGMALEAVHHKSTEQTIQDLIIDPLGLRKTSFSAPSNESTALLPRLKADAGWFLPNFGNYNPSGGLWSTPNDLLVFLQSILSHKLLSAPETRRWLQPRAFLPSVHQAVGESWEILRPTDLHVKTPRPIDIFTKPGGVKGYAANTAIIPEYDIALTITAAGGQANDAVSALFPLVVRPLVAYADKLAQEQAATQYAGTYKTSIAGAQSSLTLAVDDGPGLSITDWTMNGVPVLRSLAAVQKIPFESFSARLYPADPDSRDAGKDVWRVSLDRMDKKQGFADLQCIGWNQIDVFRYVSEPLDTVVFSKAEHEARSVELLGWRMALDKA